MRDIDMLVEMSIIQCPACIRSDRDMTFNPELKQWYCTQCYKEMGNFFHQQKEARARGLVHDDFHEEFYKTFLD